MAAEQIRPLLASADATALDKSLALQRSAHLKAPYPSLALRRDRLDRLRQALRRHDQAIRDAISADFGNRAAEETQLFEQFTSLEAIGYARRRLRRWMRPERRQVAWWALPGRARVHYQPLGVVGIVVPWNYPLYLTIGPLVAALAAGNRVMVKMSESTPRFGELLAQVMAEAFAEDELRVFNGGIETARHFAGLAFDHLLFTGSTQVGREVMRQASEHLVPVTLELGGKSPVILTDGFDLEEAARRVMTGKMANAGQTCIAPDYILLPARRIDDFLSACRSAVASMYPALRGNPQYTSIASDRHFERLQEHVADARAKGAVVHPLHQEAADARTRSFAPVAVTGGTEQMRLMQEEIFGPILLVIGYDSLDDAIAHVNARPRPLALYFFGGAREREHVLQNTLSGGVTVNNTMYHVAQDDLPFGGVGASGLGQYHAREGFLTFSKARSVYLDGRLSGSVLLRPPYGRLFRLMIRLLYR